MMDSLKKIKLIAVVGPTASGKTSLGVKIAERFGGEVISADSMQIYKGMDIATAKPAKEEMRGIKHHLIDFLPADKEYSVASYILDAKRAVSEVVSEKQLPVIGGGTGLYVDSFLNNITFLDGANESRVRDELKKRLSLEGAEALYKELQKIDPDAAKKIHPNNTVKVIRALEVYYSNGKTITQQVKESKSVPSPYEPLYIGITRKDRNKLYDSINKRVDCMLENGLLDEAREYYSKEHSKTAVNAIGYKELKPYLDGEKELSECVEELKKATRHYAKRQLTWFGRNEKINWFYSDCYSDPDEMYGQVFSLINNFLGR